MEYGDRSNLPRFHLAMCSTLGKMIEQGRYKKRYVVATREDAKFKIHRIKDNNIRKSDEVLDVCQNCLEELRYKGFSMQMGTDGRRTAVSGFCMPFEPISAFPPSGKPGLPRVLQSV